jgi:hypothetical protein
MPFGSNLVRRSHHLQDGSLSTRGYCDDFVDNRPGAAALIEFARQHDRERPLGKLFACHADTIVQEPPHKILGNARGTQKACGRDNFDVN